MKYKHDLIERVFIASIAGFLGAIALEFIPILGIAIWIAGAWTVVK